MNRTPRKRKSHWRVLVHLLFTLVALLGLAVLWLAVDVRSLDFLKPSVQGAINAAFAPYRVEAGRMRYRVDTQKWALVTGLEDVAIHDAQGHRVATLSAVNLDLGLLSLLSGSLRFDTLEVVNPALRLSAQDDGRVTLSVSAQEEEAAKTETSAPMEVAELILPLRQLAVSTVVIRDAFLGIVSKQATAMYRLPRMMFLLSEQDDVFSIRYDVLVLESDATSRLSGSLEAALEEKTLDVRAALTDFNITLAAPFHPYGAYLADASLRVSGTAEIITGFNGKLKMASVDVQGKEGSFAHPELFTEALTLDALTLRAVMKEGEDTLHIEEVSLKNADMNVKARGDVHFSDAGVGVKAEAELHDLKIERIGAYWPPHLSLDARDWVTKYLTVGTVNHATARIDFTPEDLSAEKPPQKMLDAHLNVSNASIEYLPGFPRIEGVDGTVAITANGLEVTSQVGHSLTGTKLRRARFAIPDFTAPGMPMELELDITAPARDVAEIIGPDRLHLANALKLDPDKITGEAEGLVTLTLPLYEAGWPKEKPYVIYDITAKLKDATQDNILGKWNIAGMSGDLAVNNEKLTLTTQTSLQGIAAKLDIAREFAGQEKTTYALVADIPREIMPVFGFEIPDEIQGTLGVDATVEEVGEKSTTKAKVNLANATVHIPDLHYEKPLGVPANLNITQESSGAVAVVPAFRYSAEGAEVAGGYTQDQKSGEFTRVSLSQVKLGGNDFALDYALQNGRKIIVLKGAVFDLSDPLQSDPLPNPPPEGGGNTGIPLLPEGGGDQAGAGIEVEPPLPSGRGQGRGSMEKNKEENPLDVFMNKRVELNLDRLLLSTGHGLEKLSGHIDCGVKLCPSVSLKAETGKAVPFSFVIAQATGGRELTMASQDAGGVIKAFDVSDHLVGGTLDFKGTFNDSTPMPVLDGRILISDFRVVKAPILAKLLSLASLTGFLDALSGNGIAFTKLSGDVRYTDAVIRVKKGKAYGSALGITLAGRIMPFAGTIDLKGAVVPAYTANSIIGKIPLIGHILTGGEGGGVIAANYSMKGDSADPNVRVNPLSLLTPGFLRNLFDVFDAPEEGEEGAIKPEGSATDKPTFPAAEHFSSPRLRGEVGRGATFWIMNKTPPP